MTHKIDRRLGVMAQLPPEVIQRGWEMDLAQMRLCVQCGKYLAPQLWNQPCAWTAPNYRLERLGELALGRLK